MSENHFGMRLIELRTEKGMTQAELATASGVSQAAISRIEKGLRSPAWEVVVKFSRALNVKCDEFMQAPATDAEPQGRGRPTPAKKKGKGK